MVVFSKLSILVFSVGIIVGCSSIPEPSESLSAPAASTRIIAPSNPQFDTLGIVAYAASMQGKPYRVAGTSPEQGFDCSGLVQHVFGRFNITLPRSADAMAISLPSVTFAAMRAADLIFFDTGNGPYSHVGIYLGDGRFVHAPSPQTGHVIISKLSNSYWQHRISAVHRPQNLVVATNTSLP